MHSDALIVGGGPAGLAAAIALRQKGLEVVVADALHPPIDKACGEGLMPDARKDLAALGIAVHDGALFEGIAFLAGRRQAAAYFRGAAPAWASAVCNCMRSCWSGAAPAN